ncbi:hypothetical protein ACOSQ2_001691 [Xanthoceras sorbifolium]
MTTSAFKIASLFQVTALIIFLFYVSLLSTIEADTDIGFSADLIHRNSPLSPDRQNIAFHRSNWRINRFRTNSSASTKALESTLVHSIGEYYMEFSIGTPKVKQVGAVDTGSDLIWTQCKPCEDCYKQKPPIFDPKASSTYKTIPYTSTDCNALGRNKHMVEPNLCGYKYSYVEKSKTEGDLAHENFIIGSSTGFDTVFGCGHKNTGEFEENGSGVIGLGGGPLSLISQLSSTIKGKFSYCLVPTSTNAKSKINFGKIGVVPGGPNVVSTPLVEKTQKTFYRITLEAISVGNNRLDYTGTSTIVRPGNMILDIGSTYSYLDPIFFNKLNEALVKAIGSRTVSDPDDDSRVCFKVSSSGRQNILPTITVHFTGADLKLQRVNTFIEARKDTVCFALLAAQPEEKVATFGMWSQTNFVVGYDVLDQKKVFFMLTDCAKQ